MKENEGQTTQGLNQLLEIINAKGDRGEIIQILDEPKTEGKSEKLNSKPNL